MTSRELLKTEIDQVQDSYLDLLQKIIRAMMAPPEAPLARLERVVDVPDRAGADLEQPAGLPVELQQRQAQLVAQAQQLQARLGDPIDGLAKFLSDLPPDHDEFWLQVMEAAH